MDTFVNFRIFQDQEVLKLLEVTQGTSAVINRRNQNLNIILESYKFVPHFPTPKMSQHDMGFFCLQFIGENFIFQNVKIIELDTNIIGSPISHHIYNISTHTQVLSIELNYLTADVEKIQDGGTFSELPDANVNVKLVADQKYFEFIQTSFDCPCFIVLRTSNKTSKFLSPPENFSLVANITQEDEAINLIFYKPKKKDLLKHIAIEITQFDNLLR